jgi:hypothetical protein
MRNFTLVALCLAAAGPESAWQRPLTAPALSRDQLCGPQVALTPPAATMKISGGAERTKQLFGAGEAVIINAGSAQGVRAGQKYFVRRVVADRFAEKTVGQQPLSIHTAGWITVVESQANVAVATVTEACDGISEGDYLEPLIVPPTPAIGDGAPGVPDYAHPAHLVLGDERQQMGGPGALLVMDRGTDHGLRNGQKLTVFRETMNGKGPVANIGEAVIVTAQAETSLIRIVSAREAVYIGDLIAIHR